jgi:lipocalin-like protein
MQAAILAAALLAASSGTGIEKLYGTWRLVSFTRTIAATGKTSDVFGKEPQGFISYGPDGRMMVLIVKPGRPRPNDVEKMTDAQRAELFKTMVAYAGTYTFDGRAVTHHIDVSANQNWTGSHQVRYVKLAGNRLVLTTAPGPSSYDGKVGVGTLTWEKVPAAQDSTAPSR